MYWQGKGGQSCGAKCISALWGTIYNWISPAAKFLIEGRMNMHKIEKWTICKDFIVEIFYGNIENISRHVLLNTLANACSSLTWIFQNIWDKQVLRKECIFDEIFMLLLYSLQDMFSVLVLIILTISAIACKVIWYRDLEKISKHFV